MICSPFSQAAKYVPNEFSEKNLPSGCSNFFGVIISQEHLLEKDPIFFHDTKVTKIIMFKVRIK